jgi:hypothetical protein
MLASQFSYLKARIGLFNIGDESKIGTAEMKIHLKSAGHALVDEIDIRTIRDELRVFDIGIKIADRKKNWHVQLRRMNSRRAARQAGGDVETSGVREVDGRTASEASCVTGTSFKADIDVGNDLCRAYYM